MLKTKVEQEKQLHVWPVSMLVFGGIKRLPLASMYITGLPKRWNKKVNRKMLYAISRLCKSIN